jgi:hypothetical protein
LCLSGCLRVDVGKADGGRGLPVDNLAKQCLALDNAVGNPEFAAKRRQADDNFDGVHVMGDDNQAGLLVLDQLDHVLDAEANGGRTLGDLLRFALNPVVGTLGQTLLLGLTSLRTVFEQQSEQFVRCCCGCLCLHT